MKQSGLSVQQSVRSAPAVPCSMIRNMCHGRYHPILTDLSHALMLAAFAWALLLAEHHISIPCCTSGAAYPTIATPRPIT